MKNIRFDIIFFTDVFTGKNASDAFRQRHIFSSKSSCSFRFTLFLLALPVIYCPPPDS